MPRRLQVLMILQAISPRLAMRIFLNICMRRELVSETLGKISQGSITE